MKKCLVLDLDNTLWGGVVGEDGLEGIKLALTSPGNHFVAFQQAILDVYHKGVILAVNSRNNYEDAMEVIRNHPNQILKEHHFAAFRINWNDKAENIKELAKELNLGLDSFVFLDDDETNRSLVRSLLPQVAVPDLPNDPKEYTRFFNNLDYFSSTVITDEDKMRGNLYVTERLRKEEEKQHASKEDFLGSLSLELFVKKNDNSNVSRLAQLTEKTNQFNTNKIPRTENDVLQFMEDKGGVVYHGKLHDKFGDYGVVVLAFVKKLKEEWVVESLLMSCRVFDRGVENSFFSLLMSEAKKEGVSKISVIYQPTEKNIPAKTFIEKHLNGGELILPEQVHYPSWITLHYENI